MIIQEQWPCGYKTYIKTSFFESFGIKTDNKGGCPIHGHNCPGNAPIKKPIEAYVDTDRISSNTSNTSNTSALKPVKTVRVYRKRQGTGFYWTKAEQDELLRLYELYKRTHKLRKGKIKIIARKLNRPVQATKRMLYLLNKAKKVKPAILKDVHIKSDAESNNEIKAVLEVKQ